MKKLSLATLLASAAIISFPLVTLADGGGGGGGAGGGGTATKKVKTCRKGYVLKKTFFFSRCVKKPEKKSGIIPDSELLEQGWALAYKGEYEAAIELFEDVIVPSAGAYNGLGYSSRKLGSLEAGLIYYNRALELDPDYILARNYLGKGYVTAGNFKLARLQLDEIGKRCGTKCELYENLAQTISNAEDGVEISY